MLERHQLKLYLFLSLLFAQFLVHHVLTGKRVGLLFDLREALLNLMASRDESLALVKLIRIIYLSELEVNALDIIDLIYGLFYFKGTS